MSLVIQVIISWIVTAPALWIVGRWRVGPEKAKFTDALWISGLSTILGSVIGSFIGGILGWILSFIITLFLINKYYETTWGNSLIISIASTILIVIVTIVLAALGITILS
jgi:hypothetical protein